MDSNGIWHPPHPKGSPFGRIAFGECGFHVTQIINAVSWCAFWFFTYSFTTSNCTNPTLDANFPLLHKCPRGYLNLAFSWNSKNNFEEPPFKICNVFETHIVKLTSTKQWTCSGWTSSSIIFILCLDADLRMQASSKFLYFNFLNILYRYLVHHSRCNIITPTLWSVLLYWFIWIWVSIFPPELSLSKSKHLLGLRKLSLSKTFKEPSISAPIINTF